MHDSVFGSMLAGNAENLKLVLLSSPLELSVFVGLHFLLNSGLETAFREKFESLFYPRDVLKKSRLLQLY